MNYESRLERLEQQIAAPVAQELIAYLYDGDTRPADWEVEGQRFDRGADEKEDDFPQRVFESLGMADRSVIVVHYVDSDGNGGPKLPPNVDIFDLSDDQNKAG